MKVLPVKIFFAKLRLVPVGHQEEFPVSSYQHPESGVEIPTGLAEVVSDLDNQGVRRWLGED